MIAAEIENIMLLKVIFVFIRLFYHNKNKLNSFSFWSRHSRNTAGGKDRILRSVQDCA